MEQMMLKSIVVVDTALGGFIVMFACLQDNLLLTTIPTVLTLMLYTRYSQ